MHEISLNIFLSKQDVHLSNTMLLGDYKQKFRCKLVILWIFCLYTNVYQSQAGEIAICDINM